MKPNELFISNAGTLKVGFNNSKINYWINQRIYRLDIQEKNHNWRYLFHWLTNNLYLISLKSSSSNMVPNWSTTKMKKIKISIPSLEKQEKIANLLDKFFELQKELEKELEKELILRKKQYEYYRDLLIQGNAI